MKKERIYFLVISFFPDSIGGAEKQAFKLASFLNTAGHHTDIVAGTRTGRGIYRREVREGVIFHRLKTSFSSDGRLGRLKKVLSDLILFGLLFLRRKEIKAVYLFFPLPMAAVAAFSKLCDVPCCFKVTSRYACEAILRRRWMRTILKRSYRKVITPSRDLKNMLLEKGFNGKQVAVIKNGTGFISEPETGEALKFEAGFRQDHIYIVCLSNLKKIKRVDLLLRAFAIVFGREKNVRCFLMGSGPEERRLKTLSKELSISEGVIFKGQVRDVGKYLLAGDIFVLPSPDEGCSNALLEAMSCGLACIAADIPGNREVITHNRTGVLVPAQDVQAMAEAITELLRSRERRRLIGAAAREHVLKNHSVEQAASEYLKQIFSYE